MQKILQLLFKNNTQEELLPMGTIKVGEVKPFNEVANIIHNNILNRFNNV